MSRPGIARDFAHMTACLLCTASGRLRGESQPMVFEAGGPSREDWMFRSVASFFIAYALLTSTALAQDARPNRTELKRADLTGTNMEVVIAVLEVPPGATIARHTHPGEEAVYVLEGATLQYPDGRQGSRP